MSEENLVFPSTLRANADDGDAYIAISLNKEKSPETGKTVCLYLPTGISVGDGVSYTTADLLASKVADAGQDGKVNSQDVLAGIIKGIAAEGGLAGDLVAAEGIKQGIAVNPFTSVAFEGTNIRTFEFSFNMIPESKEDSEVIKKIEKFFRKYMYPKAAGEAANLSLKYPPLFDINFYVNGEQSEYLPKIFPSYLTSLSVTYNSTSNAWHASGAPVETQMALSFQESKALIRDDFGWEDEGGDE